MNNTWLAYFQAIEPVCPWSLKSFKKGRIKFQDYDPYTVAINDIEWNDAEQDAIIYLNAPDSIDYLDDTVEDLESEPSENCIYFWSHPDHTKGGNNQAPEPVLIQQSRKQLTSIRSDKNKYK